MDFDHLHPEFSGRIIALLGYAGVGKDTVQGKLGYTRVAFADELKRDMIPVFQKLGLNMSDRADKLMARGLLVEYGKLGRAIDPNYWISRLVLPAGDFPDDDKTTVITDIRYANEAAWVIHKGGLVVQIERPGVFPANEEEQRSFDEINDLGLATATDIREHDTPKGKRSIRPTVFARRWVLCATWS